MHRTTAEFRVEPNIERVGDGALALDIHVTAQDEKVTADYRLWRGVLFGPQASDLMKMEATPLEKDITHALLAALKSARVSTCPAFAVWLHPINHHLKVHSSFSSTELAWQEELPDEWRELESAVALLKGIAKYANSGA